jgi:DNA-binding IclR family transcriptional regulator
MPESLRPPVQAWTPPPQADRQRLAGGCAIFVWTRNHVPNSATIAALGCAWPPWKIEPPRGFGAPSIRNGPAVDTTVVKALSVLELLARAAGPMRLSAIAEQLKLQKSNVHRLLSTLAAQGYVAQEAETGRYGLTLRVWELGAAVQALHPAKRAAAPYMQELHRATSETVSLTVLEGDDVLYLDKIMAQRVLRFTTRPGSRVPAALVGPGKALIAFEPDPQAIVERSALDPVNGQRIKVDALMRDLEDVRRDGYAASESLLTPGVFSVAAPIMGRDGRAAAALSVSGPIERLNKHSSRDLIEAVLNASARIAENVGQI